MSSYNWIRPCREVLYTKKHFESAIFSYWKSCWHVVKPSTNALLRQISDQFFDVHTIAEIIYGYNLQFTQLDIFTNRILWSERETRRSVNYNLHWGNCQNFLYRNTLFQIHTHTHNFLYTISSIKLPIFFYFWFHRSYSINSFLLFCCCCVFVYYIFDASSQMSFSFFITFVFLVGFCSVTYILFKNYL